MMTLEELKTHIGSEIKLEGHRKGAKIIAILIHPKKDQEKGYHFSIGVDKRINGHSGNKDNLERNDYKIIGETSEHMYWYHTDSINFKNIKKKQSSSNLFNIDDL